MFDSEWWAISCECFSTKVQKDIIFYETHSSKPSGKLRLSESRAMLAWAMPSMSNLDEVNDGKPEGRIAADFQVRGNMTRRWNGVCKDAERLTIFNDECISFDESTLPIRVFADASIVRTWGTEGLKAPGYSCPRLPDVLVRRSQLTTHCSQLIAQNVLCLILLARLARFAWVKTSDAARRRPYLS